MVKVEYFAGYNPVNGPNGLDYNLNNAVFKILDANAFDTLKEELKVNDNRVLIRIRPYEDSPLFKLNNNFKMPIFNQHILLRGTG